jgi:hypothetical protein
MIQADSLEYPTAGVCTAALHCDVFIDCDLDTRTWLVQGIISDVFSGSMSTYTSVCG